MSSFSLDIFCDICHYSPFLFHSFFSRHGAYYSKKKQCMPGQQSVAVDLFILISHLSHSFFYETMYIHFVQLSFFILLLFGKEKRRRFFWQRGSHYIVFLSLTTLYLQPVLHSTTIKPPRPKYFFCFSRKNSIVLCK